MNKSTKNVLNLHICVVIVEHGQVEAGLVKAGLELEGAEQVLFGLCGSPLLVVGDTEHALHALVLRVVALRGQQIAQAELEATVLDVVDREVVVRLRLSLAQIRLCAPRRGRTARASEQEAAEKDPGDRDASAQELLLWSPTRKRPSVCRTGLPASAEDVRDPLRMP